MDPNYLKNRDELIDRKIVPSHAIYDYRTDPLQEVYDELFKLANEHLQEKQITLKFPTTFFYYDTDLSTNAFAFSKPEYKLIGVNMGAVENMFNFFEDKKEIFNKEEYQSFNVLINRTNNPTYITIYQLYTLFLYYHEYAHLIQQLSNTPLYLDEKGDFIIDNADILDSHCREFDADWLGSSNLAMSIVQYMDDYDGRIQGSPEEVADLVSMGIAAVYCFFLKAAGYFQELYLMKNRHPHPYIRISYITQFILETLPINLPIGFKLDKSAILRKGMKLAENLLASDLGNPVFNFAQTWKESVDEMEAHINTIINRAMDKSELCRNRPSESI